MKTIFALMGYILTFTTLSAQDSAITAHHEGYIFKPAKVEASEERISKLSLPDGFAINVFARDLGAPRMMALSEKGHVYVTNRDEGKLYLLTDQDNDGSADSKQVVHQKDNLHGVAINNNYLYFITVTELFRAAINEDGSLQSPELIMDNLPDGGQHPNRTLYFGPDQQLYITVGSTCNACAEPNPENATIVVADPDGSNREIFAKGLRNTIGIDWHPQTGELFGVDHGIDWLGNTEQKEELNHLQAGNHYGWPYIYADGKKNLADEPKEGYSAFRDKATNPLLLLTAHSAPMNFKFYTGNQFPEDYKNDAFVTLHGSWNRETPVGYKVVRVIFENNRPASSEDFLTGFLVNNNRAQFGRVVGLAQLNDGSLLVSDDANGMIYRISYEE